MQKGEQGPTEGVPGSHGINKRKIDDRLGKALAFCCVPNTALPAQGKDNLHGSINSQLGGSGVHITAWIEQQQILITELDHASHRQGPLDA
jgi:hypothetical protein